jgi:hypothetical protein
MRTQFCGPLTQPRPHAAASPADPRGHLFARSIPMMDVIMLAIGAAFFALSIGYAYACDRL